MKKIFVLLIALLLTLFLIAPSQALAGTSRASRSRGVNIILNNANFGSKLDNAKISRAIGDIGAIRYHQAGL